MTDQTIDNLTNEIKEIEDEVRMRQQNERGGSDEDVGSQREEQPGQRLGQDASGNEGGNEQLNADDGQDEQHQPERKQVLDPEERIAQLQKALDSERAQRRIASREAEELRELRQRVDQLSQNAPQFQQQTDPATGEKPDRQKDPLAYLDWLDRQVTEYRSEREQQAAMAQQQQAYQQQVTALSQYGAQAEEEFRNVKPDYDDAFKHYATGRVKQVQAMGYDEQSAQQAVHQELLTLINNHAQVGSNPAKAIYEAAQALGYRSGQQQTQAKGERKSTPTMPQGGRAAKQNAVSLEALENASPEEFDQMWKEAERAGLFNQ